MELGLEGKVAIVTGGSSGIGKAIVLALAAEGAQVATCARDLKKLQEAVKEIQKATRKELLAIPADTRNADDIKSFVGQVLQRYGRVDILVNNAGTSTSGSVESLPDDVWQNIMNAKVFGFMHFIKEVLPVMRRQKWGRIINIAGIMGKNPMPTSSATGAVNAATLNLTKSTSDYVAADNILVNAVCPGLIDTPLSRRLAPEIAASQGISIEDARKTLTQRVPMGRPGQPEEVANLIAFLASERASYISGTAINVDGGFGRYIV